MRAVTLFFLPQQRRTLDKQLRAVNASLNEYYVGGGEESTSTMGCNKGREWHSDWAILHRSFFSVDLSQGLMDANSVRSRTVLFPLSTAGVNDIDWAVYSNSTRLQSVCLPCNYEILIARPRQKLLYAYNHLASHSNRTTTL